MEIGKLLDNNKRLLISTVNLSIENKQLDRKMQTIKHEYRPAGNNKILKAANNITISPSELLYAPRKEVLQKVAHEISYHSVSNVACPQSIHIVSYNQAMPIIGMPHVHQKSSSLVNKKERRWKVEKIEGIYNPRVDSKLKVNTPFSVQVKKESRTNKNWMISFYEYGIIAKNSSNKKVKMSNSVYIHSEVAQPNEKPINSIKKRVSLKECIAPSRNNTLASGFKCDIPMKATRASAFKINSVVVMILVQLAAWLVYRVFIYK